jgi:glucokinase
MTAIATEVNAILAEAKVSVCGVGIGSPGQVYAQTGVVSRAVNLKWKEVHLGSGVRSRLAVDLPVKVENDANVAALGEGYFGSGRGCDDLIFLGLGSGLGSGIVAGGWLMTGAHQAAADLGHLSLDLNGRLCACGKRGCAETLLSGPGLLRAAEELRKAGPCATTLPADSAWTTGQVIAAARQGDALAAAAIEMLALNLGQLMGISAAVVDPDIIVIGGGLGVAAADLLIPPAAQQMERYLPGMLQGKIRVVVSSLASPAIGAACLVLPRR